MCPAPELREVPVRARDGERGHVGGEPVSAGPQAPQLRHGAAGVGGREARQEVPLQPGRTPACSCPWCSPCTPTLSGASSEWELAGGVITGAGESAAPSRHSQTQISLNVHYSLKSIRNGKS